MLSIGLMSGTSMDGIDAALIETDGKTKITEIRGLSFNYDTNFKILLKLAESTVRNCNGKLVQAKQYYPTAVKNYLATNKNNNYNFVQIQNSTFDQIIEISTRLHAKAVLDLLDTLPDEQKNIDVIGYHGQTLYHNPEEKITIQVGDGQLLANITNHTVVNDFRINDIKFGGQGAPLAPLYHQALAIRDQTYTIAIVNCGGISNITIITGESVNDVIGFDTGAGNGLIDRLIKLKTNEAESMDQDGKYGKNGQVNDKILNILFKQGVLKNNLNYFDIKPPKSLDIGNLKLIPELAEISLEDACATLAAFTAETIVRSLDYLPKANNLPKNWVLVGGGWNNPVILRELEERLKNKIKQPINVTIAKKSKYIEAQAFAYLAVRSLQGLPLSIPNTTGVTIPVTGGRKYQPNPIYTSTS